MPTSNFQPIRLLYLGCLYKFTFLMINSADRDQLASSEANWSGSTLFAKAGHIRVQQDKGLYPKIWTLPPGCLKTVKEEYKFGDNSMECFSYFSIKNLCCENSLEANQWGNSNEYLQHRFLWRIRKLSHNYHQIFLLTIEDYTPKQVTSKWNRPRSDAAECSVWSGSPVCKYSRLSLSRIPRDY